MFNGRMNSAANLEQEVGTLLTEAVTDENAGELFGRVQSAQRKLLNEEDTMDPDVFSTLDQGITDLQRRLNEILSQKLPHAVAHQSSRTKKVRSPRPPKAFASLRDACVTLDDLAQNLKYAYEQLSGGGQSTSKFLETINEALAILRSMDPKELRTGGIYRFSRPLLMELRAEVENVQNSCSREEWLNFGKRVYRARQTSLLDTK